MSFYIKLLIFIVISFSTGIICILSALHGHKKQKKAVSDFKQLFEDWLRSRVADEDLYEKLTTTAPYIQYIMGTNGYVEENGRSYQFIINALPEIKREVPRFRDISRAIGDGITQVESVINATPPFSTIEDIKTCLLRFDGILNMHIEATKKLFYNPISVFTIGLNYLFHIPVGILKNIGFISDESSKHIENSKFYKTICIGVLFLFGIYSNLVTVITGNDAFIAYLQREFPQLYNFLLSLFS